MFTDQIERDMLETRRGSMNIVSWKADAAEETEDVQVPLWRRFLRSLGSSFISFGSLLTRRFGSPEDNQPDSGASRRDRAYN
jgi:hypothetical protein